MTLATFRLWGLLVVLATAWLVAPGLARAQSVTATASAPALGNTIRGTSATTFSISTAGAVTRPSGDAIRLSSAAVTAPTISWNCSPQCKIFKQIRVTISPASAGGPSSLSKFRVSNLSGSTFATGSAPADAATLTFDLNATLSTTITFKLGMDVLLAANATSGAWTYSYTVTFTYL